MKKKVFIFLLILIFTTTTIGCATFDYNIDTNKEFNEKSEKIINIIIKEYNEKYKTNIEKSKLSIYNIKPYEKGFLVLVCYTDTIPELNLIYLIKARNGYHVAKYSAGQYDINKLKVNKIEDGNNSIYFGSVHSSFFKNSDELVAKTKQGGISILLDDGKNVQEEINSNQNGYIIIINSKAMIVDFYLYNLSNEKSYFIKNFINYSTGINEGVWSQ